MNKEEKYSLADMVIEHALKSGANQAAVSVYDNRSTDIEIRNQNIDSLKESNQSGLSVEVYVDKKYSAHSTNRLKKEELFRFVEEAIAATRYLAEDEFRSLPEPDLYYKGGGPDLNNFDPSIDSVDPAKKIFLARQVLDEAYGKDERIISVSSYYSDSVSNQVKVASNGFRGDNQNSNVSVVAEVSVATDTGRPSDYWYESSLFMDKLKVAGTGEKALQRTLKKINPRKIATGKYTVIIENRVASRIAQPIYQALLGSSLYQKQSFLAGKQNSLITSPILTVVDDPLIPGGPGSRLFDDEGLAAVKRPVIEKGILRNYFIDTYYGRKLGMKPTSGSSSNIVFSPGKRTPEEMIKSVKKGIFITGFIGGNCNGSTGDFSYGFEGFYIEDGNLAYPVNEMNISGNMNKFWFTLAELGNDIRENETLRIPSLMFENADLSGI
ncbi:MAG: TldD/PmbA family protein [Bacteroidales bacterium]|nr:TldD/PmbA family protein [Bacteroidales bacterium]